MKFTLNEKEAIDKLILATEVCQDRELTLTVFENEIRISSDNYTFDFQSKIPCYNVEDGSKIITVKASTFTSTVKELGEGIEFELSTKEVRDNSDEEVFTYQLNYNAPSKQNEKGTIQVNIEDTYIEDDDEPTQEEFFEVNKHLLSNMIDKTQFAVSTSENRTFLQGVRFVSDEGMLVLVASDGSRMSTIKHSIENLSIFEPVTVPSKTIKFFKKLIDKSQSETVKLSVDLKSITIMVDDIIVSSGLIAEFYPDYKKILDKEFTHTIQVNVASLMSALNRFSKTILKKEKRVIFSMKNDKLKLEASEDGNVSERELDCVFVGNMDEFEDNFDFRLNYQFILDILRVFDSENVNINLRSEPNTAINFVQDPESPDYHMVMPLKY